MGLNFFKPEKIPTSQNDSSLRFEEGNEIKQVKCKKSLATTKPRELRLKMYCAFLFLPKATHDNADTLGAETKKPPNLIGPKLPLNDWENPNFTKS